MFKGNFSRKAKQRINTRKIIFKLVDDESEEERPLVGNWSILSPQYCADKTGQL